MTRSGPISWIKFGKKLRHLLFLASGPFYDFTTIEKGIGISLGDFQSHTPGADQYHLVRPHHNVAPLPPLTKRPGLRQTRTAQPEEVAGIAVFLAGPGATFITGQGFGVNGGSVMP